ncbi:MAG TPA: amidohydrolase family protein [Armatimonadota bacterium]|nr:amidohydrolase family protein [Armatimonadota bacterium]
MKNPSALAAEFMKHGKSPDCPVIDTHGHFGPFQGIYFPMLTADQMIESMDRCGVRCIVCSHHQALVDPQRGNALMVEVIEQHPDRFRGYLGLNPNYPDTLRAELDRYDSLEGLVGLKFLSDYHQYPITGEEYVPAMEHAQERGLPILMHTWGGSAFDSPQQVAELAARYPTVPLLMGHAGYGDWDAAIETANDHPNTYLELTAAYHLNGVLERFCNEAGSERVLFGTDLPWFDQHYGIGCIMMADITDDDRRNILHRNAEKLFGDGLPG